MKQICSSVGEPLLVVCYAATASMCLQTLIELSPIDRSSSPHLQYLLFPRSYLTSYLLTSRVLTFFLSYNNVLRDYLPHHDLPQDIQVLDNQMQDKYGLYSGALLFFVLLLGYGDDACGICPGFPWAQSLSDSRVLPL